jgi:hypothetical protein
MEISSVKAEDKGEFTAMLVSAMAIYERQVTKGVVDLFFNALGPYSLDQVRYGMSKHLQDSEDGKFSPKPADIIRQIAGSKADDGRPGKDEAWSIALCSQDESDTVLITEEILAALSVAQPLLEIRDKVAARLAFCEAYEKQLGMARRSAKPVHWIVSLGDDKGRRAHALQEGVRLGRLTQIQAEPHLLRIAQETQPVAREGLAIAGLLAGPAPKEPLSPEVLRQRWQDLRKTVSGAQDRRDEEKHAQARERHDDMQERKKAHQKAISDLESKKSARQ